MKQQILSVLLFLIAGVVYADVVPESKALQLATQLFSSSSNPGRRMHVKATSQSLKVQSTRAAETDPAFYIITPETGTGFVIVSAEDAVKPILAYSFTSPISLDGMPENISHWLEMYRNMILDVRMAAHKPTPEVAAMWDNPLPATRAGGSKSIETAQWDQNWPYNQECPMAADGNRCLTGCVATAIGITMRHHKYPTNGNGTTPEYTTATNGILVPARNIFQHAYAWNSMPMKELYRNQITVAEKMQVARLLADIGSAIQADYGPDETSAYFNPTMLKAFFRYSSNMREVRRLDFSDARWTEMIKADIDDDCPVLYSGSGKGAHAFVINGYSPNGFFEINWGWGGYLNGSFALDNFAPMEGCDYTGNQWAIFGFKPSGFATDIPVVYLDNAAITSDYDAAEQKMQFTLVNPADNSFSLKLHVILHDKNGNIKQCCHESSQIVTGMALTTRTETFPTPLAGLEVGDYYTLHYTLQGEECEERHSVQTTSNLLIAAYDSQTIEEATSITFNQDTHILTLDTKPKVTLQITDSDGGVICSYENNTHVEIDTKDFNEDAYTITLKRNKEYKSLKLSIKSF